MSSAPDCFETDPERSSPKQRTARVVALARARGFDLCGVAPVADFPESAYLEQWLAGGFAGEMAYLHDPRRLSPASILPEARSIVVCALNYNTALPASTEVPPTPEGDTGLRGWISRYAWGDDYHFVLREMLEGLLEALRGEFPEPFQARACVDTAPLSERLAAKYAGLGWLGKNTCLIHEDRGSWMFLGALVTSLDLEPSLGPSESSPAEAPPADLCGNCRLCIDACPTDALAQPYVLDARRCISYLTIELRGAIPEQLRASVGRHVFGCDICQDVCPWNRQAPVTASPRFSPRTRPGHSLFSPELRWLLSMSEQEYREVFRKSPVKRAKWRGLVRNVCVAAGNSGLQPGAVGYSEVVEKLGELAACGDSLVAEHARWALARLKPAGELPQAAQGPVVPSGTRR